MFPEASVGEVTKMTTSAGFGLSSLLGALLLCFACSSVDSAIAEQARSPSDRRASDKEAEEFGRMMEALETTTELTDGSFRSLTIGESKGQVLAGLRQMGATRVMPGMGEQPWVKTVDDLSRLQGAEGIIIGAGDVTIVFDGDDVQQVNVAPIFPEWKALLQGVRTRQEAFRALAQMLERWEGVDIRALAVDAKSIGINHMTPERQALLDKYDRWSLSHEDEHGYVYMDLDFAEGRLRRILAVESPTGL